MKQLIAALLSVVAGRDDDEVFRRMRSQASHPASQLKTSEYERDMRKLGGLTKSRKNEIHA